MLFRLALTTRDALLGLGGWSAYSLANARCRARLLTISPQPADRQEASVVYPDNNKQWSLESRGSPQNRKSL